MKKKQQLSSFISDIFLYGFGIIIPKLVLFLLIPILTRVLSPEEYGVIDLLSNTCVVIYILLTAGLDHVYAYYFNQEKSKGESALVLMQKMWGLRIVITSVGIGLILILSTLFLYWGWIQIPWLLLIIILIERIAMFIYSFGLESFRLEEKPGYFLGIDLFNVIITFSAILFFVVKCQWGILGYFLGGLLGNSLAAGITLIKYSKISFYPKWDVLFFKKMLSKSLSFLPLQLMPWVLMGMAELAVLVLFSAYELGIFAVAVRLVLLMYHVLETIRKSIWPRLLLVTELGTKAMSIVYLCMGVFTVGFMIIFNPFIFKYIVGASFSGAEELFPYLLLMIFFLGFNYIIGLNFIKREKYYLFWPIYGVAILSLLLGLVIIGDSFGILGVIILVNLATILGNIIGIFYTDRSFKYQLLTYYLVSLLFILILVINYF